MERFIIKSRSCGRGKKEGVIPMLALQILCKTFQKSSRSYFPVCGLKYLEHLTRQMTAALEQARWHFERWSYLLRQNI